MPSPTSPILPIQPEPMPQRTPLADPTTPVPARYQDRAVRRADRKRFEVRDTKTDTTGAIRTTSRVADEDVMVPNLAGPNGPGGVPAPQPQSAETEPAPVRQCGRCRQYFPADPLSDPTVLQDWWLCEPCHNSLFGTPREPSNSERASRGHGTDARAGSPGLAVG